MPNTYTQLHIHLVFAVKYRKSLITKEIKDRVEMYMTKIFENKGCKVLAIYCRPDHVHIYFGLNPKYAIADLVKEVKVSSTNFINEKSLTTTKFQWQQGYGAFANSRTQMDKVIDYILNQEKHHSKEKFQEEYINFLKVNEVDFEKEYLFDWVE